MSEEFIERTLGFDLRRNPFVVAKTVWTPEMRSRLLLRPEIDCVITVDQLVLPVSDLIEGAPDSAEHSSIAGVFPRIPPEWLTAQKEPPIGRRDWIIAVTMEREAAETRQRRHDAPLVALLRSPEELHAAGWTRLGYDCVDMGFISGLTDCEFLATDRHAVLARFGPHLNRCGLFGDPAHAMEFREVSNGRIPSHAPFEVCGIWVHPENADLSRVIG